MSGVLSVEWCGLSVFSNTSCIFKTKMNLTIDKGSFYYHTKSYLEVCNFIKVNFIDKIHTKVLENDKNTFFIFVAEKVIVTAVPCLKLSTFIVVCDSDNKTRQFVDQ